MEAWLEDKDEDDMELICEEGEWSDGQTEYSEGR